MNFESLRFLSPELPLGMLLGLVLSICFRRRPWVALVWVPTLVSFLSVSVILLRRVLGITGLRGPDAGWGAFELIILGPLLALCAAGALACYFCRPKHGWNFRWMIPAIGLTAAAMTFLDWQSKSNIEIVLLDTQGRPVSGFSITSAVEFRETATGGFTFPLRRQQFLKIGIRKDTIRDVSAGGSPTNWALEISPIPGEFDSIRIRQSWSRLIGLDRSMHESFTNTASFKRNLRIELTPPSEALPGPTASQDRIRVAFNSIKKDPGRHDPHYGDVCGNLEALDFIPELIELSDGNRAQQFSVMQGLKAIAGTLNELDEGCRLLREDLIRKSPPPRRDSIDKVARLCAWAGVAQDEVTDSAALDEVREHIFARARPLVDFCLMDNSQKPTSLFQSPGILFELGQINRPLLSHFIHRLLENPPADIKAAHGWSSVFHRMRATKTELKALVESPDPLLQATARDARE